MDPLIITLIIVGALILISAAIAPGIIIPYKVSKKVYVKQFVRINKEKWARECSDTTNEEQVIMFNYSLKFFDENKDKHQKLHLVNDGLNLYADYFDFGFDKTVFLCAGRAECSLYALFYAEPYIKAGYNICSIESRAHGDSDGKINHIGLKEYKDVLKWINLLHDELNMKEIVLHGICIGSATLVYAVTDPSCPSYVKSLTTDGLYKDFKSTLVKHIKDTGHQAFPCAEFILHKVSKDAGVSALKLTPYNRASSIKIPVLMLHSKIDKFSIPQEAQETFDKMTNSPNKKLVWFDKGAHSHIRINNQEKYDNEIVEFLRGTHA
jgi:alpha-beta hydrolase superfamily lysophospholipase